MDGEGVNSYTIPIDELTLEMAGRVRVAKLNVDENPMMAVRFNVRSIPTLLAFEAGRKIERIVGVQPKAEIVRRLKCAIARGSTPYARPCAQGIAPRAQVRRLVPQRRGRGRLPLAADAPACRSSR
jgi:thioredoxin-like negative regulator of GroEL